MRSPRFALCTNKTGKLYLGRLSGDLVNPNAARPLGLALGLGPEDTCDVWRARLMDGGVAAPPALPARLAAANGFFEAGGVPCRALPARPNVDPAPARAPLPLPRACGDDCGAALPAPAPLLALGDLRLKPLAALPPPDPAPAPVPPPKKLVSDERYRPTNVRQSNAVAPSAAVRLRMLMMGWSSWSVPL